MNILTKICVVVLVVVAVFISAAVITHANVSDGWKQKYEAMAAAKEAADVMAANEMISAAARQAKVTDLQSLLVSEKASAQDEIAKLKIEVADLKSSKAALEGNNQAFATQMAGLNSRLQMAQAISKDMQEALGTAQKELASNQEKLVDLEAKNGSKDADIMRYEAQVKVLRADISNLKELNEKLEATIAQGGVAKGNPANAQPAAPANIKGQVTTVKGDLLSINIGSAKGVREGMLLVIYRNDKFVGYLRIDEVEIDQAVGVIVEKKFDPQKGDGVMPKDI